MEDGAQAPVRADELGNHVDVGAFEFGDFAPLQDFGHDLVLARERLQHFDAGGPTGLRASGVRQGKALEQLRAELLRRADVEALTSGERKDLFLQTLDGVVDLGRKRSERRRIDRDSASFHVRQDRDEG